MPLDSVGFALATSVRVLRFAMPPPLSRADGTRFSHRNVTGQRNVMPFHGRIRLGTLHTRYPVLSGSTQPQTKGAGVRRPAPFLCFSSLLYGLGRPRPGVRGPPAKADRPVRARRTAAQSAQSAA